jgi:hypothetical protein
MRAMPPSGSYSPSNALEHPTARGDVDATSSSASRPIAAADTTATEPAHTSAAKDRSGVIGLSPHQRAGCAYNPSSLRQIARTLLKHRQQRGRSGNPDSSAPVTGRPGPAKIAVVRPAAMDPDRGLIGRLDIVACDPDVILANPMPMIRILYGTSGQGARGGHRPGWPSSI